MLRANSVYRRQSVTRRKFNKLPEYDFFFFAVALRPNAGHGLLILEVF